jgi:hypothetical protein
MPIRLFAPLAVATALAAQAPEPTFTRGNLADLTCRIADARAVDEWTQVLTIEVSNRGTAAAEPLEFRVEARGKKGEPLVEGFARAQLPRVHRHGRPTPASGKQTYQVPTALVAKKAQLTVTVVDASFGSELAVAAPDLRIGAPTQVQSRSLAGEFPVTKVALHNPFARDLDVLLSVTLQQPKDSVEIYGVRLPANGMLDWTIAQRPGARPFVDMTGGPACAMKATKVEVVDWCLVAPCPPELGAELLQPAYDAWYRWPSAPNAFDGAFTFHERRQQPNTTNDYEDESLQGRFHVDADGKLTIDALADRASVRNAVRAALQNVIRPDFATLTRTGKLVALGRDRVATQGRGWTWQGNAGSASVGSSTISEWNDLQVDGTRIVSDGVGDGPRTRWETVPMASGYVVARRHSGTLDERFTYRELDGRIVPASYSSTQTFGDKLFARCDLVLKELRFQGAKAVASVPPAGAGAVALRAIWEAGYRLPATPIEVQATFELTNPGTDLVWQRHTKVRGLLTMQGVGRRAREVDVLVEGDLPPHTKSQLAAMVRDRLMMWYGRDFADRASFDETFAGATIAAASDGTFAVAGAATTAIATGGGLVRAMRRPGCATKFTWKEIGGVPTVVRVDEAIGEPGARASERWDAAMLLTWTKVGEHALPTTITWERTFGRDWGPETLVLRDVRIR